MSRALEHGIQTSEETLQKRSGSCRDSAWLLVECLRNLGIAARFVSGYLIQLAEAKAELNGPASGPQSDSADLHAWAEAFLPGAGWIGLDPTSGLLAGEGHIPLACTSSPAQAAPISGTAERASIDFSYEMSVRRLNDARPLSSVDAEDEWLRIRQVAHRVDADLEAHDVRLTMGGEPTYVGIDEPESPQWNIDALGDDQANTRPGSHPGASRKNGARRPASLRPGKVVSGRAVASLGAQLLLARRWRSGMGRRQTHRARES